MKAEEDSGCELQMALVIVSFLTLPIYFFNGLFASQNVRPQIFPGQARSQLLTAGSVFLT